MKSVVVGLCQITRATLLSTAIPAVAIPPCNARDAVWEAKKNCEYNWIQAEVHDASGQSKVYCAAAPGEQCGPKRVTFPATLDPSDRRWSNLDGQIVLDKEWNQEDLTGTPAAPKGYWFKSDHGKLQGRHNLVPGLFVQVTGDNNPDSVRYIIFQSNKPLSVDPGLTDNMPMVPVQKSSDKDGKPLQYTIQADIYCRAGSSREGLGDAKRSVTFETSGGCNTNGEAWVKVISKDQSK